MPQPTHGFQTPPRYSYAFRIHFVKGICAPCRLSQRPILRLIIDALEERAAQSMCQTPDE
jgi:hypothetical protein